MPYNRELFRSIMNELIDGSTQIEFANTHGISPEHLSRMMRSDTAGRPSKSTLKKLSPKTITGRLRNWTGRSQTWSKRS